MQAIPAPDRTRYRHRTIHRGTAFEQVKKLEPDFENINEKLTALYLLLDDMENFLKYNQLCAHPFQAKDLENMLDLLDCKNRDEMIKRVKEIFGGSGLF